MLPLKWTRMRSDRSSRSKMHKIDKIISQTTS